MTETSLLTTVLAVQVVIYFILVAVVGMRSSLRERVPQWLIVYLLISGGLGMLFSVFAKSLPMAGVLVLPLALLFLALSRDFLQMPRLGFGWWGLGVFWTVVVCVLVFNWLQLPEILGAGWGRVFPLWDVSLGLLVAGWLLFSGRTAVLAWRVYEERERRPLHRNRLRYWFLALLVLMIGDSFIFAEELVVGFLMRILGTLVASYAILAHRLFDLRRILQWAWRYLLEVGVTTVVTSIVVVGVWAVVRTLPGYTTTLFIVGVAALVIVFFNPLLSLVQWVIRRYTFKDEYDVNSTLRQYSLRISNIVDLTELEKVMMEMISQAMEITHGTFFLVDEYALNDQQTIYELYNVYGFDDEQLTLGSFEVDSPVAAHLAQEHTPLTQYDIDLRPRFQTLSEEEREWLSSLGVEVFVPIYAKGRWSGLVGLGPKISGDRYFDNDLVLLSTLADQTAVALENARLVADLRRVNREVQQASAELAQANEQLQESDKLKSAFLGVVTHELRTPFANLIFSLELLERYGSDNLLPEQREEIEQLSKGIHAARSMVEDLVMFASFLSKQGQLRHESFDFTEMVTETLAPLRPLAQGKGVRLQQHDVEAPITLAGDRDRLSNAVHHLVHNAIKFTELGGSVEIRCGIQGYQAYFEVTDTGIGIPADKLATLWEEFEQMADSLQRGVEGLGLGLALVKYIITAHGGEVAARSEVGVGSQFGFIIPV